MGAAEASTSSVADFVSMGNRGSNMLGSGLVELAGQIVVLCITEARMPLIL
jgi:hypothetical protein